VQVWPTGGDKIEVKWRGVSTEIDEEPLVGYTVRSLFPLLRHLADVCH
jgi:hypothetical protein